MIYNQQNNATEKNYHQDITRTWGGRITTRTTTITRTSGRRKKEETISECLGRTLSKGSCQGQDKDLQRSTEDRKRDIQERLDTLLFRVRLNQARLSRLRYEHTIRMYYHQQSTIYPLYIYGRSTLRSRTPDSGWSTKHVELLLSNVRQESNCFLLNTDYLLDHYCILHHQVVYGKIVWRDKHLDIITNLHTRYLGQTTILLIEGQT